MATSLHFDKLRLALATTCLLVVLAGLPAFLLWYLADVAGLVLGALASGVIFFLNRRSRLVLRQGLRLESWQAPELLGLVAQLSARAGLARPPELWLQPGQFVNAAATHLAGQPALVVTEPLLRGLTERELAGVLAHEIAHLKHRDLDWFALTLAWQSLTFSTGLMLVILSLGDVFWLVELLASLPLMRWLTAVLSRTREFAADLGAAELTGDPLGLAQALHRITWRPLNLWERLTGYRRPVQGDPQPYRSHPDPEQRINRLVALAQRFR